MRDSLKMGTKMEKGSIILTMDIFMKETGKTIYTMRRQPFITAMEPISKALGKKIIKMGKEYYV